VARRVDQYIARTMIWHDAATVEGRLSRDEPEWRHGLASRVKPFPVVATELWAAALCGLNYLAFCNHVRPFNILIVST
jgi:hypothetical protein